MDIGMLRKNDSFYTGYEDEPGIMLSLVDCPECCIRLWEGYLEDILETAVIPGQDISGFTREYQECTGVFGDEESEIIDAEVYLKDLMNYTGNDFQYEETTDCLQLLQEFLSCAVEKKIRVRCQLL